MTTSLRGYVICAEQRSGSTYFCQLLGATGMLGLPLDYFNGPEMRAKGRSDYPQEAEAQLAAVLTDGVTANGIYGLKLFSATADRVASTRWAERLPALSFIHLQRLDLLAQAISSVRAAQTRQYRASAPLAVQPAYDPVSICTELHRLALGQARWTAFFARRGLSPLRLTYEQIAAAPGETVERVAELMGVGGPLAIDRDRVTTTVQRDDLSSAWRDRFIAGAGDRSIIDRLAGATLGERIERALQRLSRRLAG